MGLDRPRCRERRGVPITDVVPERPHARRADGARDVPRRLPRIEDIEEIIVAARATDVHYYTGSRQCLVQEQVYIRLALARIRSPTVT